MDAEQARCRPEPAPSAAGHQPHLLQRLRDRPACSRRRAAPRSCDTWRTSAATYASPFFASPTRMLDRRGTSPAAHGNAVQECRDVRDLLVRSTGTPASRPSFLNDRARSARRSGRRASRTNAGGSDRRRRHRARRPVAERAVHAPQGLPAFDCRRVARRPLRIGDEAATPLSPPPC